MAPILFGIGVEMDHVLGSVWAVGTLFGHGFSVSSDEVSLWKNCIHQNEEQHSQNIPSQDESKPSRLMNQYVISTRLIMRTVTFALYSVTAHSTGQVSFDGYGKAHFLLPRNQPLSGGPE